MCWIQEVVGNDQRFLSKGRKDPYMEKVPTSSHMKDGSERGPVGRLGQLLVPDSEGLAGVAMEDMAGGLAGGQGHSCRSGRERGADTVPGCWSCSSRMLWFNQNRGNGRGDHLGRLKKGENSAPQETSNGRHWPGRSAHGGIRAGDTQKPPAFGWYWEV